MKTTKYHYNKFPPDSSSLNDEILQRKINEARTDLGRYDGLLMAIPNPQILLSPLFVQEAVYSSRIEGTQSSLTEVLEFEADEKSKKFSQSKKDDILEIINYRLAIEKAIELLEKLPLSQRLILETHKILMQGVRGKNKSPGNYRKIPNWIGKEGESLENARFIPIDANQIPQAMTTWEKYIHQENQVDDLLKIALLHAEFESVHPFLDGNGRLGRILIPLYLWNKNLLQKPSFYISGYFENKKEEYYHHLLNVSKKNDWKSWCLFFLEAVKEQSKENQKKALHILELYNQIKKKLPQMSSSKYGITALDFFFQVPIFSSSQFFNKVQIPKPAAKRLLQNFCDKNILQIIEKGTGRKPNIYCYERLLEIVDESFVAHN